MCASSSRGTSSSRSAPLTVIEMRSSKAKIHSTVPFTRPRIGGRPGDRTTELRAALMLAKLTAILADQGDILRVHEIELEETPTNTVRLGGNPQHYLPAVSRPPEQCWWNKADASIS